MAGRWQASRSARGRPGASVTRATRDASPGPHAMRHPGHTRCVVGMKGGGTGRRRSLAGSRGCGTQMRPWPREPHGCRLVRWLPESCPRPLSVCPSWRRSPCRGFVADPQGTAPRAPPYRSAVLRQEIGPGPSRTRPCFDATPRLMSYPRYAPRGFRRDVIRLQADEW